MYKDCQLCKSTGYLPYCNENMSDTICPECSGRGVVYYNPLENFVNYQYDFMLWRFFDVGLSVAIIILLIDVVTKYWR